MVWPAVIAAGAAIGSGLLSNSSAKSREQAADKRQYELSKKLWEYQMSNSHQFQVEDLRKAGLNPMLSASAQSNTTGNVGGHISSGGNFENVLSNAVQGFQAYQQAKVQNSQVTANEATAQNQTASALEHKENARRLKMQNDYLENDKGARDAEFGKQDVSHPDQLVTGAVKDVKAWYEKNKKEIHDYADRASKYIGSKYDQFKNWFKNDSPIANAKQVDANIKNSWSRYQKHRKSHPLYGKNY